MAGISKFRRIKNNFRPKYFKVVAMTIENPTAEKT